MARDRTRDRFLRAGERAALRRPTAGDREELIRALARSRALHRRWMEVPFERHSYSAWLGRGRSTSLERFLVCVRENGAVAGVVTVSEIVRGNFQNAYLGYYALRPYDGAGYLTEGVGLVVEHAFRRLRLHRLEANLQPENLRSRALVERLGFRLEGRSPRYLKIGGRWCDHERWAILIEEWRPRRSRGRAS